jgi:hypothetical protein
VEVFRTRIGESGLEYEHSTKRLFILSDMVAKVDQLMDQITEPILVARAAMKAMDAIFGPQPDTVAAALKDLAELRDDFYATVSSGDDSRSPGATEAYERLSNIHRALTEPDGNGDYVPEAATVRGYKAITWDAVCRRLETTNLSRDCVDAIALFGNFGSIGTAAKAFDSIADRLRKYPPTITLVRMLPVLVKENGEHMRFVIANLFGLNAYDDDRDGIYNNLRLEVTA